MKDIISLQQYRHNKEIIEDNSPLPSLTLPEIRCSHYRDNPSVNSFLDVYHIVLADILTDYVTAIKPYIQDMDERAISQFLFQALQDNISRIFQS